MKPSLTILIFLVALKGWSQSTNISSFLFDNRKKADHLYAMKAYRNALPVYHRMVEKNQAPLYAKQQIANCYLKLNNIPEAEKTLESIIKEPDITDETKYKFAQVLCATKRYDEALDILQSINKKKVDSLLVTRQIKFLKERKSYMRDEDLFTIAQAEAINTSHSDFGATYFNNSVVFASSRDYDLFIKRKSISAPSPDESLIHLYTASVDYDGNFGPIKHFEREDLRTTLHDGPVTFYMNGKKAAITSSNLKGKNLKGLTNSTNVKIFFADVDSYGGFTNIKPFDYNSEDYSVGHATFTHKGNRIYFSANFEGGFGGSDIYYSDFADNEWSRFINAGPTINTAGDELYPCFTNDSTFYFASNGQGGFGGLDIFSSKLKRGKFTIVRNLGFPVNTSFDDFSLSMDSIGRRGFMSSNRSYGSGSDDIYTFLAHYIFLEGYTRNSDSLDQFIPNTQIIMKDESGRVIDSVRSNQNGKFELKLPFDKNLTLTAIKPGYTTLADIDFSTVGQPFSIDSLMVPLRRQKEIIAKGTIYSNETEAPLPNAILLLRDLDTNRADTIVLGNNGEYMFRVMPDHKYRIEAGKDGFIPNGFNLNTENINKKELLNDIVVEEVYVEKTVTYFDYDRYNVKPEWKRDLNKVLRTLKRYPETTLHIGAHADSRGSKEYNKGLSQKRANAVVDYFVGNGIDKDRITAIGFGEELILNRCSDGVVCPEEEHSKNRRAELKVQRKQN